MRVPGFCSLAESYDVSVQRLRQLGVVGEINYQPFNAAGRIVDEPELRILMRRILSVGADRLHALSRRRDRFVIAIAGGRQKIDAIRGALHGGFLNVLVTDEDVASALIADAPSNVPSPAADRSEPSPAVRQRPRSSTRKSTR